MQALRLSALLLAACAMAPPPALGPTGYSTAGTGDVHDFDFLAGAWTAHQRRLKARGVGSTDWDEFDSVHCARLHLDGVANVDEVYFPSKGWAGLTLRTFDVAKKQWSIYWVNSKTGVLFPPVHGGFRDGRGEFYGKDTDDGHPVAVRFVWKVLGPDRASWEQAFSRGGGPWEVNWTAEFTRADPAAICVDGRPKR